MTSILDRAPMTAALKEFFASALGMPCDVRVIPEDDEGRPVKAPFSILIPLWESLSGPPFGDDCADAEWSYQLTVTGERSDQVDWMVDRARRWLYARAAGGYVHPIVVPGVDVMQREPLPAGMGEDGGDDRSGLLSETLRFKLHCTPDGSD